MRIRFTIIVSVLLIFCFSNVGLIAHSKMKSNSYETTNGIPVVNNLVPTVMTLPVRYIGIDTAISGFKISNIGGQTIYGAGICYSKHPQPTINDFKIGGSYTSDSIKIVMRKLMPEQAYYVKAYILTSTGVVYGPQRTFATDAIYYKAYIQGGYLFYVFNQGEPGYVDGEFHGLVCSKQTTETFSWNNNGIDTLVSNTDSLFHTGFANTQSIVNIQSSGNYAAKYCEELKSNGYEDWYLPSQKELIYIFKNRIVPLSAINSWSSTENSKTEAISVRLSFGNNKTISLKGSKFKVIAIRKF